MVERAYTCAFVSSLSLSLSRSFPLATHTPYAAGHIAASSESNSATVFVVGLNADASGLHDSSNTWPSTTVKLVANAPIILDTTVANSCVVIGYGPYKGIRIVGRVSSMVDKCFTGRRSSSMIATSESSMCRNVSMCFHSTNAS